MEWTWGQIWDQFREVVALFVLGIAIKISPRIAHYMDPAAGKFQQRGFARKALGWIIKTDNRILTTYYKIVVLSYAYNNHKHKIKL